MKVYRIEDIWDYIGLVDAICVTTNGFVNAKKQCIMGAGIAKQAKERYKNINKCLGGKLLEFGNHVFVLTVDKGTTILSFPTKRGFYSFDYDEPFPGFATEILEKIYRNQRIIPGWALKSEIELIKQSAKELMDFCNVHEMKTILLPKPGCSHGSLDWEEVEDALSPILDQNKILIVEGRDV